MKKLTLAILLLFCQICSAQIKKAGEVIITGSIDSSYLKTFIGKPEVWFYDHYQSEMFNEAKKIPIDIFNNKFSVVISTKDQFGYFILKGEFKRGPSMFLPLFLAEKGDSINLHIKTSKNVTITGKGAAKLNFQLFQSKLNISKSRPDNSNDSDRIDYFRHDAIEKLTMSLDTLGNIRRQISDTIYNLLKINMTSEILSNYISNISAGLSSSDSMYLKSVKNELTTLYLQQIGFSLYDKFSLLNSSNYVFFNYFLNKTRLALDNGNSLNTPEIESMYRSLSSNYSGLLRDRLLISFILDYSRNPSLIDYINKSMVIVTDIDSKVVLSKSVTSKTPGAKAFNFSLTGTDGKVLSLNDLRGKTIIIDTWFNGCSGCVKLAKQLKKIENDFKNDKSVVFLSVSVDKDKSKFLDGVNSGLYGSERTKYLYTNGLGQNHPMILYYQYSSYPNLLLIDKNGKLITSTPPWPMDDKRIAKFKSLIH